MSAIAAVKEDALQLYIPRTMSYLDKGGAVGGVGDVIAVDLRGRHCGLIYDGIKNGEIDGGQLKTICSLR